MSRGRRFLRIGGIGGALIYLFYLSRQAGLARGHTEPPGMLWAIGVITLLFFVRAFVSETTMGTEADRQKDFLWGLVLGCSSTIVLRLLGIL